MEARLRPAPIRRDDSVVSPVGTEARSYALALKALQDRVNTLEADNQLLRDKLSDAKTNTNKEIGRLKEKLEVKSGEKEETVRMYERTIQQETAISTRMKEEVSMWKDKCDSLVNELSTCKSLHKAEMQTVETELQACRVELDTALARVMRLENELRRPLSPVKETPVPYSELEELRKKNESLHRSLADSEASRLLLLKHQVKSQAVLDDILTMNNRLVAVLHRMRQKKSPKSTSFSKFNNGFEYKCSDVDTVCSYI